MTVTVRRPDALSRLLWVACGLLLAVLLYLLDMSRMSGPFRDDWEVLPLLEAFFAGQLTLGELWQPYGGAHRMVVTRLLFLLDYRFFAGSGISLVAASFVLLLAGIGLLVAAGYRAGLRGRPLALLGLLVCLLLANAGQLYNLSYPFDNQWFVSTGFALAALYLGGRRWPAAGGHRRLAVMLGLAALASLGNGAGLPVWPALLVQAVLARAPWRVCLTLAAGLLLVALLWLGGPSLLPAVPTDATLPPWYILLLLIGQGLLHFFLVLLGNPWSALWQPAGIALGLAGSAYLVWRLWQLWRRAAPAGDSVLLCMALYAALAAAAITLGRFYIFHETTTPRFFTITLLFWAALLADALWLHRDRPLRQGLVLLLAALLAAPVYWQQAIQNTIVTERARHSQLAAAWGLRDWDALFGTLSWHMPGNRRNPAADHEAFLAGRGVGYYRLPSLHYRDRTLPLPEASCAAANAGTVALTAAGEYSLHLNSPVVRHRQWLVAEADGRVIGALRPYRHKGWLLPLRWLPAQRQLWTGFARGEPAWLLRLQHALPDCRLPLPGTPSTAAETD